jgi:hypothetical protein
MHELVVSTLAVSYHTVQLVPGQAYLPYALPGVSQPLLQLVQELAVAAPATEYGVAVVQTVQTAIDVAPVEVEYVPAGQGVHDDEPEEEA